MSSIIELFKKYSTETLVGYFLILWGVSYLLSMVSSLSYSLTHLGLGTILDLLWGAIDLFTGLILITLGTRITRESKQ